MNDVDAADACACEDCQCPECTKTLGQTRFESEFIAFSRTADDLGSDRHTETPSHDQRAGHSVAHQPKKMPSAESVALAQLKAQRKMQRFVQAHQSVATVGTRALECYCVASGLFPDSSPNALSEAVKQQMESSAVVAELEDLFLMSSTSDNMLSTPWANIALSITDVVTRVIQDEITRKRERERRDIKHALDALWPNADAKNTTLGVGRGSLERSGKPFAK